MLKIIGSFYENIQKHDDSATLSESIIIISNGIKVCNKNNYIKINNFKMIFAFLQNRAKQSDSKTKR